MFPLLGRFLVWLVLPLAMATGGTFYYFRSSVPASTGTVSLVGLEGKVRIDFDKAGIPYIDATTDRDVFFAMGYLHARDRLWQMETQRRMARGTLSRLLKYLPNQ